MICVPAERSVTSGVCSVVHMVRSSGRWCCVRGPVTVASKCSGVLARFLETVLFLRLSGSSDQYRLAEDDPVDRSLTKETGETHILRERGSKHGGQHHGEGEEELE